MNQGKLKIFFEFLRYVIVGGIAFVVDLAVLILFQENIFPQGWPGAIYCSTALGFVAGIAVNYLLSLAFVFISPQQRGKGASLSAFVLFVVVGLCGLLLTEGGMWLCVDVCGLHYMISKVFIAAVVLVWNYLGRKLLIFH